MEERGKGEERRELQGTFFFNNTSMKNAMLFEVSVLQGIAISLPVLSVSFSSIRPSFSSGSPLSFCLPVECGW